MKQPAQHVFEKQRQRPNHMLNWIPSISLIEGKSCCYVVVGDEDEIRLCRLESRMLSSKVLQ